MEGDTFAVTLGVMATGPRSTSALSTSTTIGEVILEERP
jgi:hypothetical protein